MRRPALLVAALAASASATALAPAPAAVAGERTLRASTGTHGPDAFGDSRHAALSATGRFVAFDSNAATLTPDDANGAMRDVFVRDVEGAVTSLASRAPGGPAGNGPASDPSVSARGDVVAFVSGASNLLGGDGTGADLDRNGVDDVYVRTATALLRVSVGVGGADPDGPSSAPDISGDGRFVAFASDAANLVDGDANGATDVFVRDLRDGTTRLVSHARGRSGPGDDASSAPAISPDGRYVSFASAATDLVRHDANDAADVFVADLERGTTTLVSVSSEERQQNAAVADPFVPVSDVSRGGRYVVFDSDASNLVHGDTNRATDVFLRDVAGGATRRVSVDWARRQSDNDSFWPSVSADGRYVAFESFAGNISKEDGPDEDLFVYDRLAHLPTLVDVPAGGGRKEGERLRQLLQRTALSADGKVAAFSSTADDLVPGDPGGTQDVYVRVLAPPRARIAGLGGAVASGARYRLQAGDASATRFRCRLDGRKLPCRAPGGRLPRLRPGVHRLQAQAGGLGMLWQRRWTTVRFSVR